ncbi:MAG: YfhO family protein, partial [Bacteroidaceae bacterium]|nr:YfhO family protein [Bacteroidaceae bacterium]
MNKLYKNHQSIIILFLLITLILVLMFAPYWINNVPFTYGTDVKTQWYQYFTEFKHLIRNFLVNKELPFYSWSTFLGSNFYASRSYYLVGDIYAYISLLFRTNFFTAYMIQTILKFYVSGFTFYYLLTVFNYKPYVRIIGSLSYAFSGWAIFYSGQLSFLSFYSFLPLYFVGIELYLRHQKKLLFTFSCALLLFTNFYFFYTVSFFTPLYFTYRYFLLKPNMRFFIKDTLLLILFYFIGIMITGVLTLPTVFYLINSNRLSFVGLMLSYPYPKLYFHQLVSALVPNYLYLYKNNIFEIDWHVVREICLYSGSATVVFLSQVFFDKNK